MLDIIIKNGLIYDGSGQNAFQADIGIQEDKIVRVGLLNDCEAKEIIDATGKCVTPGFIDPHTHADASIIFAPDMEPYIQQGVTTVITGNCGEGIAPLGDEVFCGPIFNMRIIQAACPSYFDIFPFLMPKKETVRAIKDLYDIDVDWHSFQSFLDKCVALPLGCNVAPMVGYNAIRTAVMGFDCLREATETELTKLEALTEDCMKAGAFGLSTGRDPHYIPGPFASNSEMIRMLKIVKQFDGIFASHTYNISPQGKADRMGGYKEMIEQAKAAEVRVNISHVHVSEGMAENPEAAVNEAKQMLAYFEQLKCEGIDLSYDVIPSAYSADATVPYFAFFIKPLVLFSGSRKHLAENFSVPDFRKMMHKIVDAGMLPFFNANEEANWFGALTITEHKDNSFVGKSFAACAKALNRHPLDTLMDLFEQDPDMGANFGSPDSEKATDIFCTHDLAMPCSDGECFGKDFNMSANSELPLYPNIMNISFIPRYLINYGQNDFERAVYKATGFVARRFGLTGRGEIRVGSFADIVVLDKEKLYSYDKDTNPLQTPEGFEYVIVNGSMAVRNKQMMRGAGRILRKIATELGGRK